MKQPQHYSKRILLAVSGMSPQIITETLYGLAVSQDQPFIPTEIHIITTIAGAKEVELQLLHPKTGKFKALCNEYNLQGIEFSDANINIITDHQGNPLEDIKSPQQNEAAADFIIDIVNRLTRDDTMALHVSIAGGRKTMGYYAGYALSLYGRKQDELSHVLVTDKYEGLKDFFYPTVKSNVILDRDKNSLDTKDAEVMMAKIPFVCLRRGLPEDLLKGTVSFSQSVDIAQQDDQEPFLEIKSNTLFANNTEIKMTEINYVAYRWILEKSLAGNSVSRTNGEENAKDFEVLYNKVLTKKFEDSVSAERFEGSMPETFISDRINKIKVAFIKALGGYKAKDYIVQKRGEPNRLFYSIALTKEQVNLINVSQRRLG